MCPEHEEKLKLFCVTDQQLACIICRDGEKHEGHKFKPIKEAVASLRQELEKGMETFSGDILATESLAKSQREELTKTKAKSQQLTTQIQREFKEMHDFLRKREKEIKKELKYKEEDAVEKMSKNLNAIEKALSDSRELEQKLKSVLKTGDAGSLLKSWSEGNSKMTPEDALRPRAKDLQVVNDSLCFDPYESHLQFFMWKEMLQVIKPREELLSLQSNSSDITLSDDGQSLFPQSKQAAVYCSSCNVNYDRPHNCQSRQMRMHNFQLTPTATTIPSSDGELVIHTNPQFTPGQHYWEIDVGHRVFWKLGIKDHFLKYECQKYVTCSNNQTTVLEFADGPRRIGIYLNCTSKMLSFYNADGMALIHTMSLGSISMPLSAYVAIYIRSQAPDHNPLTVCRY
ncbi:nuclear factor 7, brain-like isoform X2 [Trematomus bernacchii]|nr:nuclear factor 7, brain-like isoform X2 [Trematomus bernacchii]